MQEVTIYDIAEMAGVSPSTVSRVINHKPNISQATAERVRKLLEEYHYIPNEGARSLVNQSTKMIGILINDIRTTHHTSGVYYIQRELADHGYSCLIYNTGMEEQAIRGYLQLLSQRKVEAAVLMGSIYQTEEVRLAIRQYLPQCPVMLCNGYLDSPNIYGVVSDERQGVEDCVRLFHATGRHAPAMIANRPTPSCQLKVQGFTDGISTYYGPDATPTLLQVDDNNSETYQATLRLFREHPDTDAILFAEDAMAMIGMKALSDLGKRVPGDVSVIGVNNSDMAQYTMPSLTSLDNVLYDASVAAARGLLQVLKGSTFAHKTVLAAHIVQRESTPPVV